jgi:hypothetical protein
LAKSLHRMQLDDKSQQIELDNSRASIRWAPAG